MKKTLSRLALFFSVIDVLFAALCVLGFITIIRIPMEENSLGSFRVPLLVLIAVVPLFCVALSVYAVRSVSKELALYEQILDAIPFPISVTDLNMKWLFVNRAVCEMLNKKRGEFYGQHCSNWGAAICNTENCGITCLRSGKSSTTFAQFDHHFHVDVCSVVDNKGNQTGHIELVRDITEETVLKQHQSEMVDHLDVVGNSFATASKQIADGSNTLAQGATEQAASIEELSSSMSEINSMAKGNTQNATEALGAVRESEQLMGICMEQMDQMLEAMQTIDEKSQNISKTTKVIDDIAFQTNILALNAAVEAARAGQHGKGFAVVADEVRNLAAKSAEAAQETAALIESSSQSVTEGGQIVGKVNASLRAVAEIAQKNAVQIADVQTVSARQSEAMEQVAIGIDQMADIVQQNSATAEELASMSAEMNGHAGQLHQMIVSLENRNGKGDVLGLPSNAK